MTTPHTLILLRHGQSQWNELNLFTGWVDVDLNERGVEEGRRAGELLRDSGLLPDVLYTSRLKRAIRTANLALEVEQQQAASAPERGVGPRVQSRDRRVVDAREPPPA